jgi:hypothetical protein
MAGTITVALNDWYAVDCGKFGSSSRRKLLGRPYSNQSGLKVVCDGQFTSALVWGVFWIHWAHRTKRF